MESVTGIASGALVFTVLVILFVKNRIAVLAPVLPCGLSIEILEECDAIPTNFDVRCNISTEVVWV